jgi:hypothetical protein
MEKFDNQMTLYVLKYADDRVGASQFLSKTVLEQLGNVSRCGMGIAT